MVVYVSNMSVFPDLFGERQLQGRMTFLTLGFGSGEWGTVGIGGS